MKREIPLVSIVCTTYNHEEYIKDALEGFVMQKTNFPFEIIVHEDASTDATAKIIKDYEAKYSELFVCIYQSENQYSKKNVNIWTDITFPMARGKYIAICEGDDYWIDPFKLQKQVDFLNENPEYGVCYTNFNIKYQKSGKIEKSLFTTHSEQFATYTDFNDLEAFIYNCGYVAPPSWVIRREYVFDVKISSNDGSFVLFVDFLSKTKAYAMMDVTVVYRYLEESASHSKSYETKYKRVSGLYNTQIQCINILELSENLKNMVNVEYYKTNLILFIILNKFDEISKAKLFLKNTKESLKSKILFIVASTKFNRYLLKRCCMIYLCLKKIIINKL